MTDRIHTGRILCIIMMQVLVLTGLGCRLAYLHLGSSQESRQKLEGYRLHRKEIAVARGRIYGRSGEANILALDLSLRDVIADPEQIIEKESVADTARNLSGLIGIPEPELVTMLDKPGRRFEIIKRFIPDEKADEIKALGMRGIYFREVSRRCYPKNSLMSHILGFVNYEGVGSSGIEQVLNSRLKGCSGYLESKLDGRRREMYIRRTQDIPPQEGADVFLSLDQNIQFLVEDALRNAVEKYNAKGGCAIVQKVDTGEILGMASFPDYDPNKFTESTENQRLNRAIGIVYEPGSTMKCMTIAAAVDQKLVDADTKIFCENGMWKHRGRPLRDHHGYGDLSVADILKKSSNIGTAKLAVMLGNQRLHNYLTAFGFGTRLGIGLPGEEAGILHAPRNWSGISSSRIAIGQGVAVTPLQMLNAVCAIANGGKLMRPYLIQKVVAKDGTVLKERKPECIGTPISAQTAETMRYLMARVTEKGGTGTRARIPGFTTAGKTGTAQKPVRGGYSDTLYYASFVGFVPAERPEVGIIVVVDEPNPSHTGGAVSAPAFRSIADGIVRYFDIEPPDRPFELAYSR